MIMINKRVYDDVTEFEYSGIKSIYNLPGKQRVRTHSDVHGTIANASEISVRRFTIPSQ